VPYLWHYWKVVARDPSGATRASSLWWFQTDATVANVTGAGSPLRVTGLSALPTRGGQTAIYFSLSVPAAVNVRVLNVAGRPVRDVVRSLACRQGQNELAWDGRATTGLRVPSGRYLIVVEAYAQEGARSRAVVGLSVSP
jgi:flagellar hook assembly protein FlgD